MFSSLPVLSCELSVSVKKTLIEKKIFLHCPNFTTLLNKLKIINVSIMAENENSVVRTLLFGRPDFNYSTNKEIVNATISFILTTERFNCPLFKINQFIEV